MIDKNDPRLTAYVLGELDDKEKAMVEQAIAQTPELAQSVDEIRQTASLLTDEFASEDLVGLLSQQKEALCGEADKLDAPASESTPTVSPSGGASTSPTSPTGFVLKYWAWAAVAACLFAMSFPFLRNANNIFVPKSPESLVTNSSTPEPIGQSFQDTTKTETWPVDEPENAQDSIWIDPGVGDPKDFNRVMDLITETVTPDSMDRGGVGGSIERFDSNLSLIIDNTQVEPQQSPSRLDLYVGADVPHQIQPTDASGEFQNPVRVEFVEGTDVFIARGQKRDVDRVTQIVEEVESNKNEELSSSRSLSNVGGVPPTADEMTTRLYSSIQENESDESKLSLVQSDGRLPIEEQLDLLNAETTDYMVTVPEQEERTESYTVQVPVQQEQSYTVMVPESRGGKVVMRPEARSRSVRVMQEQTRTQVLPGTPVDLKSPAAGSRENMPSLRIPAGVQIYRVKIDESSSVYRQIAKGDKLDLSVALSNDHLAQLVPEGLNEQERTRVLSRNIEVHEVTEQTTPDSERTVKIVGLKVQPVDAERLRLAKQVGSIQLAVAGAPNRPAANSTKAKVATKPKPKTWRRVKAVPNTSRLMIGDKEELDMNGMQVHVQVDGFRARVLVDYMYYNDRDRQLEGKFKIRLPDDASLYYFAFGQSAFDLTSNGELPRDEFIQELGDGTRFVSLRANDIAQQRKDMWTNVKEARMVPREKAAYAYSQTVRRKVDPALVEWSGAGVFNANVFPLMPKKLHRIVIGYDVNLTQTEDGLAYELNLPEQTGTCKVELNVQDVPGATASVSAESKVKTKNTRKGQRFRLNKPKAGETIRLTIAGGQNVVLRSQDKKEGDYLATRVNLDLPKDEDGHAASSSRAMFLVDTSLSSRPDKFNVWLDLLRATLDNNRDSLDEFGVLFFNVENHFWKTEYVENTPENVRQLIIDCQQLALEGATDLYAATQRLTTTDWVTDSSSPDLFLFSDGAANWGETNLRLIHQVVESSELGSLFAYQTGLTGTAIANLRFLASETGGAVFSVANEDEVTKASTAHRARPWELRAIEFDGARDLLTAGRVQWVYPGQPITVVGRLKSGVDLADIDFVLERGDEKKTVSVRADAMVDTDLASRLYGQVAVGQLESLGQMVFDVAAAYSRHFRITGQTCSLLMLETEEDYKRFNIVPQQDLFVIKSRDAGKLVDATLANKADELADPKAHFMAWMTRLENMPGMEFQMPTALKLVMDDIEFEALTDQLECEFNAVDDLTKKYIEQLSASRLDYNAVIQEAQRRGETSSADAIKVLSSLIEQNTGDLVLARDVAFSAMEMSRPAQAYHLLRRIATARPYDPSIYTSIGQCLTQMNKADMAVVFYEIALGSKFQNRRGDYRRIAGTEYAYLLREIIAGRRESKIKPYAEARLESLTNVVDQAELLITMQWNTDQSDVDLHVIEPSGEECFYSHPKTRSGGQLTRDITDGFGPEMYAIKKAPDGEYDIQVKYFNTNQNRAGMRSKVYLTIYRDFGTGGESVIRKVVNITKPGQKEQVEKLFVK